MVIHGQLNKQIKMLLTVQTDLAVIIFNLNKNVLRLYSPTIKCNNTESILY